ncbi:MAG: hypothetical protein ACXACI_10035 [Candidatus Hodarchaeales archaeon]|jgi:hypothetical protein
MKMQSPLADDVFFEWLKKADDKTVKKKFGLGKNDPIQASENIDEVTKSAAFYFQTEVTPPSLKGQKIEEVRPRKLRSVKFHLFQSQVAQEAWPYKELIVPLFDQLKHVQCKKCSGKGNLSCSSCKGQGIYSCDHCKGEGREKCKNCKGEGKERLEVEVIVDLKKDKKRLEVQCPDCYGAGSVSCSKCRGLGREECNKCKGSSLKACSDCEGYGILFQVASGPIPVAPVAKGQSSSRIFVSKPFERISKKPGELQSLLESHHVDSIRMSAAKGLKDENLMDLLMLPKLESHVTKPMDQCRKEFDALDKAFRKGKGVEKPLSPLEIFPLLRLDVKTTKGARFEIYAVGSDKGYVILDRGL